MRTDNQSPKIVSEDALDLTGESPDMVQDYITSMLRELSDMASSSGLSHLSSLLQVSILAARSGAKNLD